MTVLCLQNVTCRQRANKTETIVKVIVFTNTNKAHNVNINSWIWGASSPWEKRMVEKIVV